MEDMRRTLKVIHFASQLCGISPYGSFLRNDRYENPVLRRKYLVYSFILPIAVSVGMLHFVNNLFIDSKNTSSEARSINYQILLILVSWVFITYLFTAIIQLIGQRNFFKISSKLLSVISSVNYFEGTTFSNAVIALHFVLFAIYVFRYSIQWAFTKGKIELLHIFISAVICETVTSFAAVQFLYFVFALRRHFVMLNSSLNDVVMSTVRSDNIFSLKVRKVSDLLPKRYSVISGLRDIMYRHVMLCDILEFIDSSYSSQVLCLVGSKFVHTTILLYLMWFGLLDSSFLLVQSIVLLLPHLSYEIIQLVTVVYCCKSACFQVGVI
jgi:hypothetical protein